MAGGRPRTPARPHPGSDDGPQPPDFSLESEKEISLDGNPGIEYEIEGSSEHYRTRYYLVNGKFFALQSFAPPGEPFVADTDRIFDSLRLLK